MSVLCKMEIKDGSHLGIKFRMIVSWKDITKILSEKTTAFTQTVHKLFLDVPLKSLCILGSSKMQDGHLRRK